MANNTQTKEAKIEALLKKRYPGNKGLTEAYCHEVYDAFAKLTFEDFERCMIKHRSGPRNAFLPSGPEMAKSIVRKPEFHHIPTVCGCGVPAGLSGRCEACIDKAIERARRWAKKYQEERTTNGW